METQQSQRQNLLPLLLLLLCYSGKAQQQSSLIGNDRSIMHFKCIEKIDSIIIRAHHDDEYDSITLFTTGHNRETFRLLCSPVVNLLQRTIQCVRLTITTYKLTLYTAADYVCDYVHMV